MRGTNPLSRFSIRYHGAAYSFVPLMSTCIAYNVLDEYTIRAQSERLGSCGGGRSSPRLRHRHDVIGWRRKQISRDPAAARAMSCPVFPAI